MVAGGGIAASAAIEVWAALKSLGRVGCVT